jgi:WD40 repeat protein
LDADARKVEAFLAFSADGKTLFAQVQQVVQLWDVDTGKVRATLKGPVGGGVQIAPDGKTLLCRGHDGVVRLWDVSNDKALADIGENAQGVYSPDSKTVAATWGIGVRLWDAASGLAGKPLEGTGVLKGTLTSLAFSPDSKHLVTLDNGGVVLWDVASGVAQKRWRFPGPCRKAVFAPDSRHLVLLNANGTIYVLRPKALQTSGK